MRERPKHRAAGRHYPPADHARAEESERLYGLRACLAIHARRPDDIQRIAYARSVDQDVRGLVRWAAAYGVPCDEMRERELSLVADSEHHEGLVMAVRPRAWVSPSAVADALVRTRGTAIALDRVRNPYNVGAILRSAAFFGLDAVILGAPAPQPVLVPLAVRVAEGGTESVALTRTTDLGDTLARLRAKRVLVVGADGHANANVMGFRFERPCAIVLGNEREGLTERVRSQCDATLAIRGSGAVESLNVSVAAGLLMGEIVRS